MCFGLSCMVYTEGTVKNINDHSSNPVIFRESVMTIFSISKNKDIIKIKLSESLRAGLQNLFCPLDGFYTYANVKRITLVRLRLE